MFENSRQILKLQHHIPMEVIKDPLITLHWSFFPASNCLKQSFYMKGIKRIFFCLIMIHSLSSTYQDKMNKHTYFVILLFPIFSLLYWYCSKNWITVCTPIIIAFELRIRGNRAPAFYLFLRALDWRIIQILSNFTLKKGDFWPKSGVLIKMAF